MSQQDYEGFDLTMYNLFTLLREMYYTRGETETNFLQKSGGVVSGSLTIQGNLVVNGQSYSIDTENLKVGDYTITLAKDNEQTLTSMVGMVVPKYDGTNYGFFGWDADGYAYVGDLTNYDGTSAITLANNSSLQRISTIDTTNTVVASNGVIYVYDATSHCFKKPTNDNKYYVIRNGAFVETELFTEQKSKNIDNALYNLGAFDTISGNTITRQTGYKKASELTYGAYNNSYNLPLIWCRMPSDYIGTNLDQNDDMVASVPKNSESDWNSLVANTWRQWNYVSGAVDVAFIFPSGTTEAQAKALLDNIYIQYKLATSYTESIIENQPLLNLDSNGCNWLQNEWEKGLNLFDLNDIGIEVGTFNPQTGVETSANNRVRTKKYLSLNAGTYTISYSGNVSKVVVYIYNTSGIWQQNESILSWQTGACTFTVGYNFKVRFGFANANDTDVSTSDVSNLMLVKGTHSYPYEPPYGAIVHKVDIEPVLLWENPNYASQFDGVNSMTIKDRSPYKYLKIFVALGAGNNIFQVITLENAPDGYSTELSLGDGEKIWSRNFKFLTSTTVKIGNGVSGSTTNNLRVIPRYIYGTNVL